MGVQVGPEYADSGHEHFSGSLVVPVMDENGIISEVYGRKILGAYSGPT
jgi:hypothetical protein